MYVEFIHDVRKTETKQLKLYNLTTTVYQYIIPKCIQS